MIDIIIKDIWDSLDLLITILIVTFSLLCNTFFVVRFIYMLNNSKDPIQAFNKKPLSNTIIDSLVNEKEYNKINDV
jgi:hypothetical protein